MSTETDSLYPKLEPEYQYVCNLKKSPKDKRDFIFRLSTTTYPDILDYRPSLQNVRNQGKQGTCYAQAAACMKEWQEKKDNGFDEYMSPQFFYNNRTNLYDANPDNDNGMYGRDVMKLLQSVGICRESSYPYGKIEEKTAIDKVIYDEAKEYIIKSYARVESITNLKESLFKNGPCLVAFPVYNYGSEFWKGSGSSTYGGHAVTIVGYTEDGFIIRNSWGTGWGNRGYSIYKYEDWGAHWEIWTTIDYDMNNIYIPTKNLFPCCCLL